MQPPRNLIVVVAERNGGALVQGAPSSLGPGKRVVVVAAVAVCKAPGGNSAAPMGISKDGGGNDNGRWKNQVFSLEVVLPITTRRGFPRNFRHVMEWTYTY